MQAREKGKVGIWGFGVVGKSSARYFCAKKKIIEIFDDRTLTTKENRFLKNLNISRSKNLDAFLKNNDFILPSPGIDLRPYKKYQHKWITELDIIQKHFTTTIIAITGTAGKTTVTHLLSELLKNNGIKVWTGGNIGTCMLDLLSETKKIDVALLEVSSFQLEQCKTFAPDVAIWTNFSENHLNRHGTLENYFLAKKKILEHQKKGQVALLPESIALKIGSLEGRKNNVYFFNDFLYKSDSVIRPFGPNGHDQSSLELRRTSRAGPHTPTIEKLLANLPKGTFRENALILSCAVDILSKMLNKKLFVPEKKIHSLPHRLKFVATINSTTFYNDSKSTTPASTVAAVQQLSGKPLILFLGGLSKGIDRKKLIADVKPFVKTVYTFGAESKTLLEFCAEKKLNCFCFKKLEDAFAACAKKIKPNDQILFSPAGSSFDQFKNYKERGDFFKQLVLQEKKKRNLPSPSKLSPPFVVSDSS